MNDVVNSLILGAASPIPDRRAFERGLTSIGPKVREKVKEPGPVPVARYPCGRNLLEGGN